MSTVFIYQSHANGVMPTTTAVFDDLLPLIHAFENDYNLRLAPLTASEPPEFPVNVHAPGRFAPIGCVYPVTVEGTKDAPAPDEKPLPSRSEPVVFTVKFTMVPDTMVHQNFHLSQSKETYGQRIHALKRCMALEIALWMEDHCNSDMSFEVVEAHFLS